MLFLSLVLAFIPSLIWLMLFLREDVHPEPNRMVVRVFVAGMLVTVPTIAIQAMLACAFLGDSFDALARNGAADPFAQNACTSSPFLALPEFIRTALFLFFGIALVEEFMKYLAVRFSVMRDPNFDEPIDALLYLIIAALGFAAVENVLTVSGDEVQQAGLFGAGGVMLILTARSLSATLLHTLASGFVGYFLGRSFFSRRPRHHFVGLGIIIAAVVHGLYNGLVGGTFGDQAPDLALTNVVLLLVVTGSVLLAKLRHLRTLSARHQWQNRGGEAEEIA